MTNFNVNKADLEFILKQIKISEEHASGNKTLLQAIQDTYGVSAADAALLPAGLRTVDGSFNNLLPNDSLIGAADTLMPRLTDPVFMNDQDGDQMPLGPGAPVITNTDYAASGSVADADPRIISNLIVDLTAGNPAAVNAALAYHGITGQAAIDAAAAIRNAYLGSSTGPGPAALAAIAAQAAEAAALVTLNTETTQQAAALLANTSAQGLLAAYNQALLQDVDAKVALAQNAISAMVSGLGPVGSSLTDADFTAFASANAATVAAASAANAAVLALQSSPAVAAADLASAQAIAGSVASLLAQLNTLNSALSTPGGAVSSDMVSAALASESQANAAVTPANTTTAQLEAALAAAQAASLAADTQVSALNAIVTQDVADLSAAITAREMAETSHINALAAQSLAAGDLTSSVAAQTLAQTNRDNAQVAVNSISAVLALDVEVKAAAAQTAVAALVSSLGSAGQTINAADIAAYNSARSAALLFQTASADAATALGAASVDSGVLTAAQTLASQATALYNNLGTLNLRVEKLLTTTQFTIGQNALALATAQTVAANTNTAQIVAAEAAAMSTLANAEAVLATAVAAVSQDTADLAAATSVAEAAGILLASRQTSENDAVADLAASTALRDAALLTQSTSASAVAGYTAALALDVELKVASAQGAIAALQSSLGAAGSPIDSADHEAAADAVAAALAATAAADQAVTALQSAQGISAADLASAQAVASTAAAVLAQVTALDALLSTPASNLSTVAFNIAASANGMASSLETAALANASQLTASQLAANTAATSTAAALLLANAELAAANTAYNTAVAASDAADIAAAEEAANGGGGSGASLIEVLDSYGIEHDPSGNLVVPNLSPDIGLSPGFNSWMTFFGQFFDHGLDLITKGNNGTVYIPLQPDDPLYVEGSNTNFMVLTRATSTDQNGVALQENKTTSWIDQNQTYTSHPSHQVFLREYTLRDVDGAGGNGPVAVATGHLLDGTAASGSVAGAVANWGEVKAQALEMLGLVLTDFDVHNVPLLATDPYGRFIPGANGYAQVVMPPDADHAENWLLEGNAAGLAIPAVALRTGHGFLDDIAHHAAPSMVDLDHNPATPKTAQVADADIDANHNGVYDAGDTLSDVNGDGQVTTADFYAADLNGDGSLNNATYDDEMLAAHFITGDGRGNENIALSAVHSIFHSEHNRTVEANKTTILQSNDLAFINEWLVEDISALPTSAAQIANLVWDGERLFQAARFTTEMQYQHLVFEEFARRIQPNIDPFVFNNSPNIDASIVAEFAHTVYRFGHSMLNGTVDRLENDLTTVNGEVSQQSLLAAFLNPIMYTSGGTNVEKINADLIRGLTLDLGSEIDEFVVQDLRSNLVGLPLDLAALNIARGRETGVPSLNETRQQLYDDGALDLKPYVSWSDFAQHLKNPTSLVNFIAAYGTHASITSANNLAEMRDAASLLVFGDGSNSNGVTIRGVTYSNAERLAFLNGSDAYTGSNAQGAGGTHGGLNLVDLWIGGLAEAKNEFGGMLGTTFNYIFEYQMEQLQSGDRLYYLSRTQGTNLLNNLEPNTFSDLVMRNTELGDKYATHLNSALFVTPDAILELDRGIAQADYNGAASGRDPEWDGSDPLNEAILGDKVVRDYSNSTVVDGNHDVGGTLRFLGGEHVVLGGTEGNDILTSDKGIDTLWGDDGNDYLNAGTESDNVFGGNGDDIIEDPFGDDMLRGNGGNDVISAARGIDLIFGEQGADYLMLGQDGSEVFGGTEGDFILGSSGADFLLGNEGDDWMEGGAGFDTLAGDNSDLFFNSPIIGHDVMFNQGDEGDYDAESGDDIMGSGPSVFRYEGMAGFDWAIAKYDTGAVQFDLEVPIFTTVPANILRDRFDLVEALSGWNFDDTLEGDARGLTLGGVLVGGAAEADFANHLLTQEGIDRIAGMNDWIAGARATLFAGNPNVDVSTFRDGNILLGGDGSDTIRGRAGFDLIDGDAWLNVRIAINMPDGARYSAESMSTDTTVMGPYAGKVFNVNADGSPNFSSPAFGGRNLNSLLLDRTINPGQLSIVREILDGTLGASETDQDTAVFFGNLAEYDIEGRGASVDLNNDGDTTDAGEQNQRAFDLNGDGFIAVRDLDDGVIGANGNAAQTRGVRTDGIDLLKNIEILQFADQSYLLTSQVTDIAWNAVNPTSNTELPVTGAVIANLSASGATSFALAAGSSAGFAVSAAGVVTRTGAAMTTNQTYTVNVEAGGFTESFVIRTGTTASNTQAGTSGDNIFYGIGGGDNLSGLQGDDALFGQAGADTLDGGEGNDSLNGGSGADILIGGIGEDRINTGAANDNLRDVIRYTSSAEFGDTVSNFDANGTVDLVQFAGALNVSLDDGNDDDNILFAQSTGTELAVTVGQNNADIEGLLLTGATTSQGVLSADLSNKALVAAAFNSNFAFSAAEGEDAVLVVNDSDGNSFAVYHWNQLGGGEIEATELSLVGVFTGNATVTNASFDFV